MEHQIPTIPQLQLRLLWAHQEHLLTVNTYLKLVHTGNPTPEERQHASWDIDGMVYEMQQIRSMIVFQEQEAQEEQEQAEQAAQDLQARSVEQLGNELDAEQAEYDFMLEESYSPEALHTQGLRVDLAKANLALAEQGRMVVVFH